MKATAQYCLAGFSTPISITTPPLFILSLLFVFTTSAYGQHDDWELELRGEREVEDASLQSLEGDSLGIASLVYTGKIHLNWILRLQRGGGSLAPSLILGALVGGATGYYIGSQNDSKNAQIGSSSSEGSGGVKGGLIGMCVGGALGGISGVYSGREVYRVSEKSPLDRRAIIRKILVEEGRTVPPESGPLGTQQLDIVYLKNGSTIRGTVVAMVPDSVVRVITADSSVFVFRTTEIEQMTKEQAIRERNTSPPILQAPKTTEPPSPPRVLSFTLYGGIGLPMGEFSKSSGATAGYAKPGFAVGGDLNYMLGDIVSWVTSVNFSFNTVDEAGLGIPGAISRDIGSWFLVWPMTGIRIAASSTAEIRPYVQVQGGLLAGSSPSMSLSNGSDQFIQSSASSTSVAFSLGIGLHAGRTASFGARYLYGEPEYATTVQSPTFSGTNTFKQPTAVFVLFFGLTP